MSLQFQQIADFGFVHAGLLWQHFKSRFGNVQYHPPLSPTFETFGLPPGTALPFQFNFGILPSLPRLWFVNDAGDEVLQFQADRFVHNWRKVSAGHDYPHYEHIKERFAEELVELNKFLSENDLGELIPNQSEVTYVNVIRLPDGEDDVASKVFKNWAKSASARPMKIEDVAIATRSVILDENTSQPIGRLSTQSAPGVDDQGRPVTQFTLVGRGPPKEPTIDSALNFMDIARDRIVCGFAELTTDEMHKVWKRRK